MFRDVPERVCLKWDGDSGTGSRDGDAGTRDVGRGEVTSGT